MEYGQYYHVYNHANGVEDLFKEEANFNYFLMTIQYFLTPVVEMHVYCLMPNHFHLLIKVREADDIKKRLEQWQRALKLERKKGIKDERFCMMLKDPALFIKQQFSNCFNSYSQAYNKYHKRKGSLFRKSYKYKKVGDKLYLKQLVLYIHNNAVHHGFCNQLTDWSYSSFQEYMDDEHGLVDKKEIYKLFKGRKNLIRHHQRWKNPFKLDEF